MDENTCGKVSKLKWRFGHFLSFSFFSPCSLSLAMIDDDDVKKKGWTKVKTKSAV